ncbi:MAG: hypothetical protein Kow0029_23820 [Candidatus Rifleibacteriota bacterium]
MTYLLKNEHEYVEEIHRILFETDSVKIFPEVVNGKSFNGWIYMAGEQGSADWNLARLIGAPEIAKNYVNLLPDKELQLLVRNTDVAFFQDFEQAGIIRWFYRSGKVFPKKEEIDNFGLEMVVRSKPQRAGICLSHNLECYLLKCSQVVGLVKTVRETVNFAEVYIEVSPELRGKGLGKRLLNKFEAELAARRKRLVYAVDAENEPSLGLAKSVGLANFANLVRLSKKKAI